MSLFEASPFKVQGTQFVADFHECQCAPELLSSALVLEKSCEGLVVESGLTIVGKIFHQFVPGGATGLLLLAESHLAVHTWPEFASLSVDLYVCNVTQDNREKATSVISALQLLFLPQRVAAQTIERGVP